MNPLKIWGLAALSLAALTFLAGACDQPASSAADTGTDSPDTGEAQEQADTGISAGQDAAAPSGKDAARAGLDASTPIPPDAAAPGVDAGADIGGRPGPYKVLFDDTKSETAGSADWVVFTTGRYPSPKHATKETDWTGGLSSWGYELDKTGRYSIEELTKGSKITFGVSSNAQDLSNYQVYIVCEPNNSFSATEAKAIVDFVRAGGGLFMIADHAGADRDNDGVDAVMAWNGLFDAQGDPFGVRYDANDISSVPDNNVLLDNSNPILHGAFGTVTATTYYNGSSMTIDPTKNSSARGIIWRPGLTQDYTRVTFAVAEYGMGRVAAIGDSSPADDGTGTSGLQDGWNDPQGKNRELFLNATAWLAWDTTP
jgi:hypothetical protein